MKAFIIAFVLTLVNLILCKYTQGAVNYENLVSQVDMFFKVKNKQKTFMNKIRSFIPLLGNRKRYIKYKLSCV